MLLLLFHRKSSHDPLFFQKIRNGVTLRLCLGEGMARQNNTLQKFRPVDEILCRLIWATGNGEQTPRTSHTASWLTPYVAAPAIPKVTEQVSVMMPVSYLDLGCFFKCVRYIPPNFNKINHLMSGSIRVRVTLRRRFTASQLILAPDPSSSTTRDFFLHLYPCVRSPSVTSLTRGWICLLWICFAFVKCMYRTYTVECYWEFFLVHYIHVLCQSRLCKTDHVYSTYLMLQRRVSHLKQECGFSEAPV
jgi:hypothetical protein